MKLSKTKIDKYKPGNCENTSASSELLWMMASVKRLKCRLSRQEMDEATGETNADPDIDSREGGWTRRSHRGGLGHTNASPRSAASTAAARWTHSAERTNPRDEPQQAAGRSLTLLPAGKCRSQMRRNCTNVQEKKDKVMSKGNFSSTFRADGGFKVFSLVSVQQVVVHIL